MVQYREFRCAAGYLFFFDIYPHFLCDFFDLQDIGWGIGGCVFSKILHQFYLAFRVSYTGWTYLSSDTLRAIMHPQPSGEKTISITYLNYISIAKTDCGETPGKRS